jgi:hypothetical protein
MPKVGRRIENVLSLQLPDSGIGTHLGQQRLTYCILSGLAVTILSKFSDYNLSGQTLAIGATVKRVYSYDDTPHRSKVGRPNVRSQVNDKADIEII